MKSRVITTHQPHPLGHNILGNAEHLRTYTTADALRFVNRNYRPDKMVFFVYGDIDFKRLCKNLERLTPEASHTSASEPASAAHIRRVNAQFIEQNRSTHQAHVMEKKPNSSNKTALPIKHM